MDARTKWLMKQPTFWLGLLVTIAATGSAVGLIPIGLASKVVAGFIAVCNLYGVNAAHMLAPPRVPLVDMSTEQRQKIFEANPAVRERFYLEHPELLPTTPPPLPPQP